MKILHLRASNFYGGPERQLHLHARFARGTEFDITVASFSEGGDSPEFLKMIARDEIKTHLFEVKNAYDRKAIKLVRNYINVNGINILCTHDYRCHLLGYRAVQGTSAAWIAFSRGWTKDTLRVRIYTLLEKIFVRFARHIVAVSEAQKIKLTDLGIDPQKISVVYNAVNVIELRTVGANDLRKRFQLPADSILVVAGGRFSQEKGQQLLLEAAYEILKLNHKIYFILFGDGPDFEKIKSMVNKLKLGVNVLCPGFEKDFLGCLKNADILVNTSYSEGLPNIVLEGMALGVPVVATSVGGVPEIITDGVNGILVPAGDKGLLSMAILKLADDKERRSELARAGAASLEKKFSFERQYQDLTRVYFLTMDRKEI